MVIKYIDDLSLTEKRTFIRVDFNVAIEGGIDISDDTRIRAALPTIRYALGHKAKVILASHLGRPKGKRNPKYSLKPVCQRLAELLEDVDVLMPEDCIGDAVRKLASDLLPGQVMLLENLRFHAGEEANDEGFAKQLADLAEVYINDAFGAAHRSHASTTGMVRFIPVKGAGFLIRTEIAALTRLIDNPERPFVAVFGGAKVSDKIGVIENLLNLCDDILIGGGMAYTFLAAKGVQIGKSLFEKDKVHTARRTLERADTKGVEFLLPMDHVVAPVCEANAIPTTTDDQNIPDGTMGLDIGPKTVSRYCELISRAKSIFWNGPMGVFEIAPFAVGTKKIAKAIVDSKSISVVGGGDSVTAVKQAGLERGFTHISTGGGASLEFVEGRKLPGLVALEQ